MSPNILLLDIETAPNTAYVWGLYDQNIAVNQVVETGRVLSWAAKWFGDDVIHYSTEREGRVTMLEEVHTLLNEADAVVHYNGTKFDIPTLNKEFLESYFDPPSPFIQIDLLKTVRKHFKFTSNKLDFVCQELKLGGKLKHEGMGLWVKCMEGNEEAWGKMVQYNIQDVILLEKLYERLTPWITGGINHSMFSEDLVCPKCGSDSLKKQGHRYTGTLKYQRYQCGNCGAWSQDKKSSGSSTLKEAA